MAGKVYRSNPDNDETRSFDAERVDTPRRKPSAGKKSGKKPPSFFKKLKKDAKKLLRRFLEWVNESKRNTIIAYSVMGALALLIVLVIVLAIVGGSNKKPQLETNDVPELVDEQVAENYEFVDTSEYAGTLLEKTDDAGAQYIEETLFIGDSNTARIQMFGLLSYSNVIGIESMGIQGVSGTPCVYFAGYDSPVSIPKAVSLMKPRRIIINFGTNNIAANDAQSFIDGYDAALKKIKAAYQYADIIVEAIHPLGENNGSEYLKQSIVDEYNLALIKYCKANGYPYLDTAEVLKDTDGWVKDKFIYTDGVHLTKEAFTAILSYARTHSHIVDDARPQPIGNIPTQLAPPVKETEPDAKFDPASVASSAQSLLVSNGFTVASGHSGSAQTTWTWTCLAAQAKSGAETNLASELANGFLAQNQVRTGAVVVSYNANGNDYIFTVSIYATTHTHKYAYTSNNNGTHNATCSGTGGTCDKPTVTNEACSFGAWTYDSASGKDKRTCDKCKYVETRAHEHTVTTWTPKDDTNHTGTCTGCKQTVTEAHTYGDVVATTAATCTTAGSGKKTCPKCNHSITVSIDALGHALGELVVVTPATCTTEGSGTKSCTRSGCTYTETVVIPALGHTWTEVSRTDNGNGTVTVNYTCSCGATKTETEGTPVTPESETQEP